MTDATGLQCKPCVDCGKLRYHRWASQISSPRCGSCGAKKRYEVRPICRCVVCGIEFLLPKRYTKKATCSPACRRLQRSEKGRMAHAQGRYKNPTPRKRSIVTCETCGRPKEVLTSQVSERHFCSRECHQVAQRQITGTDHPLFKAKVAMACEVCGELCQVKPSLVKRFRFCSRNCTGAWVVRNQPRVSSIEDAVAVVLEAMSVKFDRQARVDRFVPDFVVGNTIIEVDGTYWHSLPKVVERDIRKNRVYASLGYAVIRISEADVRAGNFAALTTLSDMELPHSQMSLFSD